MSNIMKAFKEILDENCEDFLWHINNTAGTSQYRHRRKDEPGFPILEPANDEYYEYSHFERYLEWHIRDMLVNPTISAFFEYLESNTSTKVAARFPNDKTIHVGSRNESYEDRIPFEFIITNGKENIGYRYTPMYEIEGENYIDDNIRHYKLHHIEIIHWKENYKIREYYKNDKRFRHINIHDFFLKYFDEAVYQLFIESIKNTVKKANEVIGFKTIPSLSLRYLYDFKEELREKLTTMKFEGLDFRIVNRERNKSKKFLYLEKHAFNDVNIAVINSNYERNAMYDIMLGNSAFAKCYITSEYLYRVFSENEAFDYTAVVCGYLKSVELLLEQIVKIDLEYPDLKKKNYIGKKYSNKIYPDQKTYKRIGRNGKTFSVDLIPLNKYYSENNLVDYNIGSLSYYLCDNNRWRFSDVDENVLRDYLLCFTDECRNEYFHKGILDDFKKVKRIRDNTHFILYLLLGGCNSIERIPSGEDYFGCNEKALEFGRLYRAMAKIPLGVGLYIVEEESGKELKLIKLFHQDLPEYDEFGNIDEAKISFVKVDSFDVDYVDAIENVNEENLYIIDKNHMPKSIRRVLRATKEERPVTWK